MELDGLGKMQWRMDPDGVQYLVEKSWPVINPDQIEVVGLRHNWAVGNRLCMYMVGTFNASAVISIHSWVGCLICCFDDGFRFWCV